MHDTSHVPDMQRYVRFTADRFWDRLAPNFCLLVAFSALKDTATR